MSVVSQYVSQAVEEKVEGELDAERNKLQWLERIYLLLRQLDVSSLPRNSNHSFGSFITFIIDRTSISRWRLNNLQSISIIFGRIKMAHFNFVLDQVSRRFAKLICLSSLLSRLLLNKNKRKERKLFFFFILFGRGSFVLSLNNSRWDRVSINLTLR